MIENEHKPEKCVEWEPLQHTTHHRNTNRKESKVDKATQEILADLALIGYSVVNLTKTRQAKAAEALRSAGIIYIDAGNETMWIVKFGRKLGHTPSVIA